MFEDSLLNQSIVRNRHKYRNTEKFSSAFNFFYFKYCFSSEKNINKVQYIFNSVFFVGSCKKYKYKQSSK